MFWKQTCPTNDVLCCYQPILILLHQGLLHFPSNRNRNKIKFYFKKLNQVTKNGNTLIIWSYQVIVKIFKAFILNLSWESLENILLQVIYNYAILHSLLKTCVYYIPSFSISYLLGSLQIYKKYCNFRHF